MKGLIVITGLGGLLTTSACSFNNLVKTTCKTGVSTGDACSTKGEVCVPAEEVPKPCSPDEYVCTDNKWEPVFLKACNPPVALPPKQTETSTKDVEKAKEAPPKAPKQPSEIQKEEN